MKSKVICAVLCSCITILAGCTGNTEGVMEESSSLSEESVQESETAQPESESETVVSEEEPSEDYTGKTTLTYIGHAAVKIVAADGRVIYIDPHYYAGDYTDEADFLLVTHGHDDHAPHEDVKLKADGQKITWVEAHHDDVYEKYDFGSIQIEAVPAGGNTNHSVDSCVGYIVTVDGVKIYHAGDTSTLDTMGDLTAYEIDYAMYPIDGLYNMDATEATEVANLIAAKNNIPIHEFDDFGKKKSDKFLPEGRLIIEYGETIVVNE